VKKKDVVAASKVRRSAEAGKCNKCVRVRPPGRPGQARSGDGRQPGS